MLNLALVGCGLIADSHLIGIQRHVPDVKVTACVDTDLKRAQDYAHRTGAQPFAALDEALAEGDFDAVDLMLPHDLHEEAVRKCFAANKHVMLEKPLAHNLESAMRILSLAKQAKTKFMVAEQAQYWQDVVKASELIRDGYIGDILTARMYFFDFFRAIPGDPIPWRFRVSRSGGGVTIDGGAHWIRPTRMMLGEIESVVAATQSHIENHEGETLSHAILKFESGVIGHLACLKSDNIVGPINDFRVTGTKGELIIQRAKDRKLVAYTNEHRSGETILVAEDFNANAFGYEIDDFAQHVLHDRPLAATGEYSLGEFRTAQAIYRSAESGQWERVWD